MTKENETVSEKIKDSPQIDSKRETKTSLLKEQRSIATRWTLKPRFLRLHTYTERRHLWEFSPPIPICAYVSVAYVCNLPFYLSYSVLTSPIQIRWNSPHTSRSTIGTRFLGRFFGTSRIPFSLTSFFLWRSLPNIIKHLMCF